MSTAGYSNRSQKGKSAFAFSSLRGGRPDEEGTVIFHAQCRLRTLAGALLSELQRLERTYGLVGYREQWEHDFPVLRLAELRELLN